MAKNEKPPANQSKDAGGGAEEGAAKPKSKKPLLIAVGVLLLAVAGGAGWYLTRGDSGHADAAAKKSSAPKLEQPRFIPLETFTVNLQREEGDQFLQVGISLKITDPALEERIKSLMPEIRSRLLLLLSGKRASELAPVNGKKILAREIISEINGALGFKTPPVRGAVKTAGSRNEETGAASAVAASQPEAAAAQAEEPVAGEESAAEPEAEEESGIQDVLFTSFIIQ